MSFALPLYARHWAPGYFSIFGTLPAQKVDVVSIRTEMVGLSDVCVCLVLKQEHKFRKKTVKSKVCNTQTAKVLKIKPMGR